ncbi:hypothetical protein [Frankia sp. Cas3]|uniref:hypothetical protein n=1 Tax=Frankia sp. Cas3 TaxID=3073926 RepID=UPI002AD208EB|nr:hypothetical protein [Frankia sp. Cas3]
MGLEDAGTALSCPRPSMVLAALHLARRWCTGHAIDGAPAMAHAVRVAVKLCQYYPTATAELVAAVLLHDSPYFVPDGQDLDIVLSETVGNEVCRIVRAIEQEHFALAVYISDPRRVEVHLRHAASHDRAVVLASAADKAVSLASIMRRVSRAGDICTYWSARSAFVARIPYFWFFVNEVGWILPVGLAEELSVLVAAAERSIRRAGLDPRTDAGCALLDTPREDSLDGDHTLLVDGREFRLLDGS